MADSTKPKRRNKISTTALILVGCFMAAAAAAAADESPTVASPPTDNYWLEWIGTPEVSREHGRPKKVSSVMYTGNEPNGVLITKEFGHSFDVKKGGELEVGDLLGTVGLKFDVKMSTGKGNKTAFSHRISLDRRSKGTVMFNEDMVRTKGRARKKYSFNLMCYLGLSSSVTRPECYKSDEDVDIEVLSTELDESGHAKGTFSVEYEGTDKWRHEEFHHLANRTARIAGARELEGSVKSSYECAERAKSQNSFIAIYDVENMKCRIKEATEVPEASLYDGRGHLLGHYNPMDSDNMDLSETYEPRERDRWIKAKRCDLIYEFLAAEDDTREPAEELEEEEGEHSKGDKSGRKKRKYLCKKFSEQANSVVMFHRVNKNTKKQSSEQPEAAPVSESRRSASRNLTSSRRKKEDNIIARPTAMEGDKPHPKFYILRGRQYPVSSATQKIKNVVSAYDCAEQAIGSEKFLVVYKPRDRVCLLEPVVWGYGRMFDGKGKSLGPYGMIHLRDKELSDDSEKAQAWFKSAGEGAKDACDLVHETDEGAAFACKSFEFDANENSIVMLRYVDPYEVNRIIRNKRQREYDRLLFSGSQHEHFYSINNRDFPLKCVRTIPGVNSARQCGDAAVESGKYLAVYKPSSNICILKEVDVNEGQAFDRWNKQLGYYDIPFYDAESSSSSADFDRWVDHNECDMIHVREDGQRTCKRFPTTDDAVLMLRRI